MVRIQIVNDEGKIVGVEELTTLTELQQVVERARQLIRDCERLVESKRPPRPPMRAPYS